MGTAHSSRRSSDTPKIRRWSSWELWEADEIRLDCGNKDRWRSGHGEQLKGIWDQVEDSKARVGTGQLLCTNLRLIWTSAVDREINVSIGLNTITSLMRSSDSDGQHTVVLLSRDPWGSRLFEFRFSTPLCEEIITCVYTAKNHLSRHLTLMVPCFDLRTFLATYPVARVPFLDLGSNSYTITSTAPPPGSDPPPRSSLLLLPSLSNITTYSNTSSNPAAVSITSSTVANVDRATTRALSSFATLRAKPNLPFMERLGESLNLPPYTVLADQARELFLQERSFGQFSPALLLTSMRDPVAGTITLTNMRLLWVSHHAESVVSFPLYKVTQLELSGVTVESSVNTSDRQVEGHRLDVCLVERSPALFPDQGPLNPNDERVTLCTAFFIRNDECPPADDLQAVASTGEVLYAQLSSLITSSRMPYSVVPLSPRVITGEQHRGMNNDDDTALLLEDLEDSLDASDCGDSGAQDYRTLCVVCMSNPIRIAFSPCGHFSCCSTCSRALRSCPICRKPARDKLRIFQCGVENSCSPKIEFNILSPRQQENLEPQTSRSSSAEEVVVQLETEDSGVSDDEFATTSSVLEEFSPTSRIQIFPSETPVIHQPHTTGQRHGNFPNGNSTVHQSFRLSPMHATMARRNVRRSSPRSHHHNHL